VTRAWDELVASVFDVISPQLVLLILLIGAGLTGALWYWYPAWVPRRLPRLRLRLPRWLRRLLRWRPRLQHWRLRLPHWRFKLPRWRFKLPRKPKKARTPKPTTAPAAAAEPATVAGGSISVADQLAAEGRYAEAIRQRLRDTVGALVAAGVVSPEPGETATEVAAVAAGLRPAVAAPLGGATELFSEVWYGDRPAGPAQDEHMRTLSGEVRARLGDGGAR